MKKSLLAVLLGLATSTLAFGEVNYVDDKLVITLRSGQGNAYQILKTLESGAALTILSRDGEFAFVRTQNGMEGWVRTQYLSPEPIARDKLAAAQERLANLESEKQRLGERIGELRREKGELDKLRAQLESENGQMRQELERLREVAGRPIELEQENTVLKKEVGQLKEDLRLLEKQAVSLRDRANRDWFLAGGGVLLTGLLLGLILPRMRKRSSWGDFR